MKFSSISRLIASKRGRCGELLKLFNNERARTDLDDGAVTQKKAAEDVGLSERQRVTAVRVANVPIWMMVPLPRGRR